MHVFTYGSLMFPEVWERVVRARHGSRAAVLQGYARFAVPGTGYPGLVASTGGIVHGVLYLDVGDDDVAALDAFEGEDYRRIEVSVADDQDRLLPAQVYLFRDAARLEQRDWDPARFDLAAFLAAYCAPD